MKQNTPSSKIFSLLILFISIFTCQFSFSQDCTDGGIIGDDQIIDLGEIPDTIFNIEFASGGDTTSSIDYLWIKSDTEGIPWVNGNWEIIPNSNTPFFVIDSISETTYFAREARRSASISFDCISNIVAIQIDPSTNISTPQEESFSIVSNPVTEFLNIQFRKDYSAKLILFSVEGKIVKEMVLDTTLGSIQIDVSDLNNSIYFLRIENLATKKYTIHKVVKY